METEEAARVEGASRSLDGGSSIVAYKSIDTGDRHYPNLQEADEWLLPSGFALSLGLLVDLGIFKNVETSPDIRLSF